MTETNNAHSRRGFWLVVGLAAVFLGPLALAIVVYQTGWFQPAETGNHGTLVEPAQPVSGEALEAVGESRLGEAPLRRRWTLLYVGGSACEEACRRALYNTRQARLAQGRGIERIRRLFVLTDTRELDALQAFVEREHGDVVLATVAEGRAQAWARQLQVDEVAPGGSGRVYVIDPLGNLMMVYPQGFEAGGMIEDLEHLLDVSQIG